MSNDRGGRGIDSTRVILGGLLAGIVYNAGGITSAILMDLQGALSRLGWQPTPLAGLLHLCMRFGFGLLSVFLYAAIRSTFGPGPRTALVAGLLMWLSAYLPLIIMMSELMVFTPLQALMAAAWGLFEACTATVAGAWFYRDTLSVQEEGEG